MWAALFGDTLSVKALLEGGADTLQMGKARKRVALWVYMLETFSFSPVPSTCGKDGMTALMYAATNGHALAVKALLEGGADIGQVDEVRKSGRWGATCG